MKQVKFNPRIHHRRSIRLKEYDYTNPGAYFITLVTQNRINLFGEITNEGMHINQLGEILRYVLQRLPEHFSIQPDEWVIMPNHMHAIIWILDSVSGESSIKEDSSHSHQLMATASLQHRQIGTKVGSLSAIIQNFKSVSTRKINHWIRESDIGKASVRINLGTPSISLERALETHRSKIDLDPSPQ